jgi:hypothetical protein
MRVLLIAATIAVFSTSVAYADDVMASRYGNTTIVTDMKGVVTKLYYKADGTLTAKESGKTYAGTWKVDSAQVCLHFTPAVPDMQEPFCRPVAAHKIGDSWVSVDRKVKLVEGIQ